jgi:hypothetical protein
MKKEVVMCHCCPWKSVVICKMSVVFSREVPANKFLKAGGVPANKFLKIWGVPANKYLKAGGVPANKFLKSGGVLANKLLKARGVPANNLFHKKIVELVLEFYWCTKVYNAQSWLWSTKTHILYKYIHRVQINWTNVQIYIFLVYSQ